MSKSFLLIDGSDTMHGISFAMSGGRMDRFRANPVMLYMHQRGSVIGRWENLRQEGEGWMADPVFDVDDEDAKKLAGKVERGFLKACSVGVAIHNAEEIGNKVVATDWEVFECSIVDAGSNANALSLYTPAGEQVKNPSEYIQQLTLSIMDDNKKKAEDAVKEIFPKSLALAAGLAETANAADVEAKVVALAADNVTLANDKSALEAKVQALELAAENGQKTTIKAMLDQAVADKKISATERPHYEKLAAADLPSVQAIIAKLTAPVDLVTFASQGKVATVTEELSLAAEYDLLFHAKGGKLAELKASDPDRFKQLFKAKYGTDYVD